MRQVFDVTGMSCAACQARVERAVRALTGIKTADVNLLQNQLRVEFEEGKLDAAQIEAAVRRAGYGISPHTQAAGRAALGVPGRQEARQLKRRFIFSLFFLLPLIYVASGTMWGWPGTAFWAAHGALWAGLQALLAFAVLWINRMFFTRGFKQLFALSPNMDSLVALGAGASVLSGLAVCVRLAPKEALYFESAAMILTLVTLGKWLEARAKVQTSDAIGALVRLLPPQAHIVQGTTEKTVPVEELRPGDVLSVRMGERLAADAQVIQGSGAADESALTGESLPQEKLTGSHLSAGTLWVSGYVQARVTRAGSETTLARLIALVEEASASKAPVAQLADRVSAVFVPTVLGIAVVTFGVWLAVGASLAFALSCAVAVLVISCPCALGLATPTAIMVGMGQAAKHGILIKSAAALERLHTVHTVVLDKTGTVTTGQMQVVQVHPEGGILPEELLAAAGSLEYRSAHPFAQALMRYVQDKNIAVFQTAEFQSVPGRGVQAVAGNQTLAGGNLTWMQEQGISFSSGEDEVVAAAQQGATALFFAKAGRALGNIWFADTVKPEAQDAVARLSAMSVSTVLLTGDNQYAARTVARRTGIATVIAGVLPQDKEAHIRRLQQDGKTVAMVGDGINDAAALARADVGIALGSGTDVAAESADMVLMRGNLHGVAQAIRLSGAVMRTIRQNLFWAFFYNILGIPLAAGVFYPALGWKLHPVFAAAAMSLSSVCVVSNALRLRFFRPAAERVAHTGGSPMQKTLTIEGMMCGHCAAHVERALNALPGVQAKVDLAHKTAVVQAAQEVSDEVLKKAVQEAGYEVVAIR